MSGSRVQRARHSYCTGVPIRDSDCSLAAFQRILQQFFSSCLSLALLFCFCFSNSNSNPFKTMFFPLFPLFISLVRAPGHFELLVTSSSAPSSGRSLKACLKEPVSGRRAAEDQSCTFGGRETVIDWPETRLKLPFSFRWPVSSSFHSFIVLLFHLNRKSISLSMNSFAICSSLFPPFIPSPLFPGRFLPSAPLPLPRTAPPLPRHHL